MIRFIVESSLPISLHDAELMIGEDPVIAASVPLPAAPLPCPSYAVLRTTEAQGGATVGSLRQPPC
jgi:hypothetical protein